jgi:hypothetical protein
MRLVDELERVVTKVFGEILSDLKKARKVFTDVMCSSLLTFLMYADGVEIVISR